MIQSFVFRISIKSIGHFIVVLVCLNISCSTSLIKRSENSLKTIKYEKLAFSKFGIDSLSFYNKDKSYVLCLKSIQAETNNPNALTRFFVYDLNSNKTIYEDNIASAVISWYSKYELLVSVQKGISISPEDKGKSKYIYNLKTGKKYLYNTNSEY